MPQENSLSYSVIGGLGAFLWALVSSLALLVVELMAALFTYFYLAIFEREWFGWLIGHSREVLNFCIGQIESWFPSFTNAANATLIGELAPKSMLLLLIGLVVGAAIRLVIWLARRLAGFDR
ncbi:MAG: hypothetical protein KJ587_01865 [Alphaproteobacteria bacterium]|nr:hypothetical protein [Alphaproteobacteria bacterium]